MKNKYTFLVLNVRLLLDGLIALELHQKMDKLGAEKS